MQSKFKKSLLPILFSIIASMCAIAGAIFQYVEKKQIAETSRINSLKLQEIGKKHLRKTERNLSISEKLNDAYTDLDSAQKELIKIQQENSILQKQIFYSLLGAGNMPLISIYPKYNESARGIFLNFQIENFGDTDLHNVIIDIIDGESDSVFPLIEYNKLQDSLYEVYKQTGQFYDNRFASKAMGIKVFPINFKKLKPKDTHVFYESHIIKQTHDQYKKYEIKIKWDKGYIYLDIEVIIPDELNPIIRITNCIDQTGKQINPKYIKVLPFDMTP